MRVIKRPDSSAFIAVSQNGKNQRKEHRHQHEGNDNHNNNNKAKNKGTWLSLHTDTQAPGRHHKSSATTVNAICRSPQHHVLGSTNCLATKQKNLGGKSLILNLKEKSSFDVGRSSEELERRDVNDKNSKVEKVIGQKECALVSLDRQDRCRVSYRVGLLERRQIQFHFGQPVAIDEDL